MSFTDKQVEQLLQPIHPSRVLADGKGHAHVSQQDILAHLIRVFGFGNFDTEVLSCEMIFESPAAKNATRFDVCYRALVRLTIRDENGNRVAHYENGSTATAQNQTRGDAHDLAMKSAISLSVKRAAIALGDQFGLSLYNKGQRTALVRGTLVGSSVAGGDVQDGVPQQVSMGNDEIDKPLDGDSEFPTPATVRETVQAALDATPGAEPPPAEDKPAKGISEAQRKKLHALVNKLGLTRDQKLAGCAAVTGHEIASTSELTFDEARVVIDRMEAKAAEVSA